MKTIDMFKDKVSRLYYEFMELRTDENISIKDRIDYKNKTLIVNFTIINKPTQWTRGVFNMTDDNLYIPFWDYDYMKKKYIVNELKHTQIIFDLGDIHLFKSSEKGFHAVCFSKVVAMDYISILECCGVDTAFKNTPRYVSYRNWVLRNFSKGKQPKPKYLCTFKRKTNRQQSTAHHKYFSLLYPNKISKLQNPDGIQKLEIVDYPTGQNIK